MNLQEASPQLQQISDQAGFLELLLIFSNTLRTKIGGVGQRRMLCSSWLNNFNNAGVTSIMAESVVTVLDTDVERMSKFLNI